MRQRLSELIRGFTCVEFPRVKTKAEVRREASKKAWRSRKKVASVRAEAEKAKEQDAGREAA